MTRLALVLALLAAAAGAADPVETDHYRLVSDGPQAEAEEFARVLEAAWPQFAAYFKAKPKIPAKEKLEVRFFETREPWAKALTAAGATAPEGVGGMYWEGDKVVYLYRQPLRLTTRTLLLHEATHQFHFLARTRNKSPVAYWYREGVAECLSWHDWDGRALELGVLPAIALEDYPGKALKELQDESLDLQAIIEAKTEGSRPVAWAIYRHISTGSGGKPLKGFDKFSGKMNGGVQPSPLFWRTFGQPAAYRKELVAWLEKEQQPFVPLFNEWEPLGPGRIHGFAGVVSACRLQAPATQFEATIEVPKEKTRWRAGGLVHYASPDDYAIFLVDWAGYLRITRRIEGRWQILEQGEGPGPSEDGNYHFQMFQKGGKVFVMFKGGASYGPWDLPNPAFGLAIENCDLAFRDVTWK